MRVFRLASCAILALAALPLAGCGRKQAQAPEANVSAADASATMLENGTVSDITALDATVGSSGGMAPANDSEASPAANSIEGNSAVPGSPSGNSE